MQDGAVDGPAPRGKFELGATLNTIAYIEYRHTQIGHTAGLVFLWGLIVLVIIATASAYDGAPIAFGAVVFLVVWVIAIIFGRLTVTVGADTLIAAFGLGWPKRAVEIADIAAFRHVRNKWYFGWGIRKIVGGWMFNVWGLDAVEIDLHSGGKIRIGTDEAADLMAALSLHTSLPPSDKP